MKTIKFSSIAKTATLAGFAAALTLGLAGTAEAA
ncbi:MAG: hypothetical protein QOH91_2436, partial [Mycobacterium sp.]|nr:hypothetical protein [Mycobacterium sp.]